MDGVLGKDGVRQGTQGMYPRVGRLDTWQCRLSAPPLPRPRQSAYGFRKKASHAMELDSTSCWVGNHQPCRGHCAHGRRGIHPPSRVTRARRLCHKKLAFSAKPFRTSAPSAQRTDPKGTRTVPRFHPIGAAPKPWGDPTASLGGYGAFPGARRGIVCFLFLLLSACAALVGGFVNVIRVTDAADLYVETLPSAAASQPAGPLPSPDGCSSNHQARYARDNFGPVMMFALSFASSV
jgi:hypothetical protein